MMRQAARESRVDQRQQTHRNPPQRNTLNSLEGDISVNWELSEFWVSFWADLADRCGRREAAMAAILPMGTVITRAVSRLR